MKIKILAGISFILLFSLMLSACSGQALSAAEPEAPVLSSVSREKCTPGSAEASVYINPKTGFCFLYPADFQITELDSGEIRIESNPAGFPGPRLPFAQLSISPAQGHSLDELVQSLVESYLAGVKDLAVDRHVFFRQDEPVVVLDRMPGQDFSRHVLFVHANQFYHLVFYPADAEAAEFEQMLSLYELMIGSFGFADVGEQAACASAGLDEAAYTNEEAGYCLLYPSGFVVDEPEQGVVVVHGPNYAGGPEPLSGFVNIQVLGPAEGRSASEISSELVAPFQGTEIIIERVDALLGVEQAGSSPASNAVEMIGMPGQSLTWQVVAVHNDQVYLLVFSPLGAEYGQAFDDMQQLYDVVMSSFRFLD